MKITRPAIFVFAFILMTAATYAQDDKIPVHNNEIALKVGIGSIQEFATSIGEAIAGALYGETIEESKGTGAFTLAYHRFASDKFSYGASLTWEKLTTTYSNDMTLDWNVFALMVNGKYYYVVRKSFRLYSGLAAGYAIYHTQSSAASEKTNGAFAFQADAIGFRFGNNVAAFAELGFGYEGLVKLGLAFKF